MRNPHRKIHKRDSQGRSMPGPDAYRKFDCRFGWDGMRICLTDWVLWKSGKIKPRPANHFPARGYPPGRKFFYGRPGGIRIRQTAANGRTVQSVARIDRREWAPRLTSCANLEGFGPRERTSKARQPADDRDGRPWAGMRPAKKRQAAVACRRDLWAPAPGSNQCAVHPQLHWTNCMRQTDSCSPRCMQSA